MSEKILQVNFRFSVSPAEYKQAVAPLADELASVSGLRWKIWIMNESEQEAGGIYLFDDKTSMKAFLEGPIVAQVTSHPSLSEFSVKQFDIVRKETLVTRGPIKASIST